MTLTMVGRAPECLAGANPRGSGHTQWTTIVLLVLRLGDVLRQCVLHKLIGVAPERTFFKWILYIARQAYLSERILRAGKGEAEHALLGTHICLVLYSTLERVQHFASTASTS